MAKFAQRYAVPDFDFARDLFEGVTWTRTSSRGTGEYEVTLHPKGFTCDCPGFTYRGRCKHTESVSKQIKEAVDGKVPTYTW